MTTESVRADEQVSGPATQVGAALPRKEDARFVTGQTNWTDNIQLPGMLHMAFVRSPMAHAPTHGSPASTSPQRGRSKA